jgi:GrpB-like predicted nucleotidyltransferase (UPF0157 family)
VTTGVAVQIAEYSSQWPLMFEAESHLLRKAFLPEIVEIEHIGSTAVPGMAAKPVIDMLLGASSMRSIERQIAALASHGYRYVSEFEDQLPQRRYFVKPAQGEALFHLHAVESGSQFWRDHVAFRDVLRADRRVFDGYLTLKRNLAESLRMDRDSYTEAKAPFIEAVINGQPRRA